MQPGKEARSLRSGCWRLTLLSCVLAMHLIPGPVHGNVSGTNVTEPDNAVNATSILTEGEGPAKANDNIATITAMSSSARPDAVAQRAGRIPRAGEEDEQSSGMFGESVVPAVEEAGVAAPPPLIPDSAETELLLPSNPLKPDEEEEEEAEEEEERLPNTDPPWIHSKDTAVFDLDRLFTTTAPPPAVTNPSTPDVLHVDFFDPSSRGRSLDLAPASPSSLAHELQGGDPTSWAMPDSYDYLTPYEDGVSPTADEYTYSTTTDAYESDEDLRLSAGSPSRPRPRVPSSFLPGATLPGAGAPVPNAPPAASPVDGSDGLGGCRAGFQAVNGSCRSPCDMLPNYCFNGGQCYLQEGVGVFCRCNVQDYIWHKGARCESVVTEFQVMCLAVGASALVVLLLFMIVVCFAKKLHVLKTENKKLRKRSKYRPSSEQHNDNFSLSTIAEGSHPNNKLEDPVKASPKEDDSLNIHNSLTPKHENHKVLGEDNSSEVNSLQNNMM
ncbi:chondroitin sulfate proteoglycan 5 isoform X10 [Platichthys flesus]|uniref:chondroitin sulfate proteoglycan 5 isoform X10 n=1 Tax=Platichthys flesus TaxID=8260 RepID=UPI002DB8F160|nr:chondroitin sulfate proteoglycan 5 isoform X10 [Platichthys flesus]